MVLDTVGRGQETTVESQLQATVSEGIYEQGRMVVIGECMADQLTAGTVRVVDAPVLLRYPTLQSPES